MTQPQNPGNPAPPGAQPPTPDSQPPYSWVRTGDAKADKQIKEFLTLMQPHWTWTFIVLLVVLSLTVVPFLHWIDVLGWQTGLSFVITLGFLFFFLRAKHPKRGWRRWLQIAGLVLMPAALPYLFGIYVVLVPRNLDKRIQNHFYPPTIYYINAMVEEEFGDEDSILRAHAERWNPDSEEGQAVRDFILLSARRVKIRANEITPFEDAPEDGKVNVVVFQNITAPASPDKLTALLHLLEKNNGGGVDGGVDGGSAKSDEAQPSQIQPQLQVCFLAGVSPDELRSVKSKKDLEQFPIACRTAPNNLDLKFEFFVKGFAAAKNIKVKINNSDEEATKEEGTKPTADGQPSPGLDAGATD